MAPVQPCVCCGAAPCSTPILVQVAERSKRGTMANIDRELSAQLGTTPVARPLCRTIRQRQISVLGNTFRL